MRRPTLIPHQHVLEHNKALKADRKQRRRKREAAFKKFFAVPKASKWKKDDFLVVFYNSNGTGLLSKMLPMSSYYKTAYEFAQSQASEYFAVYKHGGLFKLFKRSTVHFKGVDIESARIPDTVVRKYLDSKEVQVEKVQPYAGDGRCNRDRLTNQNSTRSIIV